MFQQPPLEPSRGTRPLLVKTSVVILARPPRRAGERDVAVSLVRLVVVWHGGVLSSWRERLVNFIDV